MKNILALIIMTVTTSTSHAGRWIAEDIEFGAVSAKSRLLLSPSELSIPIRTFCFNPGNRNMFWLFSKSFACDTISLEQAFYTAQFKNSSTIGGTDTYYLSTESGVSLMGNPYKISPFDLAKLAQAATAASEKNPIYLIVNKDSEIVRVLSTVD